MVVVVGFGGDIMCTPRICPLRRHLRRTCPPRGRPKGERTTKRGRMGLFLFSLYCKIMITVYVVDNGFVSSVYFCLSAVLGPGETDSSSLNWRMGISENPLAQKRPPRNRLGDLICRVDFFGIEFHEIPHDLNLYLKTWARGICFYPPRPPKPPRKIPTVENTCRKWPYVEKVEKSL